MQSLPGLPENASRTKKKTENQRLRKEMKWKKSGNKKNAKDKKDEGETMKKKKKTTKKTMKKKQKKAAMESRRWGRASAAPGLTM